MEKSFSNGNGPGGAGYNGNSGPDGSWPSMADWYAGQADGRLLWHWAALT